MSKLTFFIIFVVLNQYVLSNTIELEKQFGDELFLNASDSQTISISYKSNSTNLMSPPRLFVKLSENYSTILTVFVKYPGGSESWQLPINKKNVEMKLLETAHTLWTPMDNDTDNNNNSSEIVVNFSTSSKELIFFNTQLSNVQNFNVPLQEEEKLNLTLSQPIIRYFKFKENENTVLITVIDDSQYSHNRSCMTFSIQNTSDTVLDTLNKVSYRGLRQTVIKQGGIIVSKEEYPFGLLLVFILHSLNECNLLVPSSKYKSDAVQYKTKHFKLNITPTVDFIIKIMSSVVIILFFSWILIFCILFYRVKSNALKANKSKPKQLAKSTGSSTIDTNTDGIENYNSNSEDDTASNVQAEEKKHKNKLLNEFKRLKTLLFVSDLSLKNHEHINAKSKLYLWNLITVAIFYSLPVIQLVFSFQKAVNDNGNQDLCYYNFFCSNSLIIGNYKLNDFNHIFSNIGYVFFGLLFIIIVCKRELGHLSKKNFGTPRHSGLYYSMGAALALEGLMSACYHVCPNATNFQFDTSFMYVICMICMVKIYQTRHPDINASAYFIYGTLAFVIIIGLVGIYAHNNRIFNVFFFIIHLTICVWLSAYIYYVGLWKFDIKTIKQFHEHIKCSPRPYTPKFKDRIILLGFGFFINFVLALTNVIVPDLYENFPSYLLALFIANLILYLFFYLIMKFISKERMYFESYLYLIIAMVCWCAALYYYNIKISFWDWSPAESRNINKNCVLFKLFDYHDIWHFLSATSLFFSFMVLLTMDDDLSNKLTTTIIVF